MAGKQTRLDSTLTTDSGIWAPTLRYEDDTFWIFTTLVHDDKPQDDASRWDNVRSSSAFLPGKRRALLNKARCRSSSTPRTLLTHSRGPRQHTMISRGMILRHSGRMGRFM